MGRVLNRTDSLGLHQVQLDSFPFSADSSFRQLDDVFLQTQTRVWLGEVLKTRLEEETSIADLLADGIILCEVSTVIWKLLLAKFMKLRSSKPSFSRSSSRKNSGRYMPYSNVDAFLKICQMLGLTGIDLFSPSDVVEKRDIRRVCMCIRSVSKHARFKNLNVPDFDVVTCTVVMPTDMVKGIRHSLEQSRFKFSEDSVGCSTHLSWRPKYGQENWGAEFARECDSYSEESDNTDSSYQVVGFDSPTSTTSCGGPSLLNSDLENSPQGSFVVHPGTTSYIHGCHTDSDESAGSSEHGKGYVFDLHRESDFYGPDPIYKTKVYQLEKKLFQEIEDADLSSTACSDFGKADTTDDEDEFKVPSILRVVIADDSVGHHSGGVLDPCIQSLENHPCEMPTCTEDGREAQSHPLKPVLQALVNHEDIASSTQKLVKETLESNVEASTHKRRRRRKLLLKSFAGGMSLVGVLLLIFHVRRPNGRDKIKETIVAPAVQIRKISKKGNLEKSGEQRKPNGVYPTDKLGFYE